MSRQRARINHLAGGPEQRARDVSLRDPGPLKAHGWIYGFDAERAALEASR